MSYGLTKLGHWTVLLCAGLVLSAFALEAGAHEAGLTSPWQDAQMSQVRLLAGRQVPADREIVLGIEVALEDGWKTYWRSPGDAGGVPPELDWSGSENVAETQLLFPAPKRFTDKSGETIGYDGKVVLPVLVRPSDPGRAVELRAQFHYGICREICVPVTAELALTVPPQAVLGLPEELAQALSSIPRSGAAVKPSDPKLVAHAVTLEGAKPRIVLDVDLGPGAETGDVFAEASEGIYLPMPQRTKDDGSGLVRFEIDLLAANDLAELKGKTIRVTMVGSEGQSEASFVAE